MPPAGLTWSVVTESPKIASARAPWMAMLAAFSPMKNGGSSM